jgi:CheY-like chemotaxis protein
MTASDEPNRAQGRSEAAAPKLVYVVDDEPMLLELATVALQPLGYRVKTFRDPGTALRAFAAEAPPPALVITDYAMHSMNGLDLVAACRRVQPNQKILLVSGTVDERVYREAAAKPNRFLAKPYQPKQLLETVQSLIPD